MLMKWIGQQISTNAYQVLAGYYDQLMDEVDYDAWCDYVLSLVTDVRVLDVGIESADSGIFPEHRAKVPHKVLDLACGTGEFTYRFRQRGFEVTATDISSAMLTVAEAKARSLGLAVQFVRQDMRALELPGQYDMVFCLCDSLNYLLESADWAATFQCVANLVRPGGHFIFDVNTAYKLATVYGDHTYAADQGDFAYIWENEYQADTGLCYMDLAFFRKRSLPQTVDLYEKLTETHVQRALSLETITQLIQGAGLELLGQYGDLTYLPLTDTTERITFLCGKS